MKALDVAVSFRVMISGAPVGNPQTRQGFQEAGGGELRAVVSRERQADSTTACRKPLQDRPLDRRQSFLRPATVRQVPAHDLSRAAVDHRDQVRPTDRRSCPDFRQVRLPV